MNNQLKENFMYYFKLQMVWLSWKTYCYIFIITLVFQIRKLRFREKDGLAQALAKDLISLVSMLKEYPIALCSYFLITS